MDGSVCRIERDHAASELPNQNREPGDYGENDENASTKPRARLALPYKSGRPVRDAHERIIVSSILNLLRAFRECG